MAKTSVKTSANKGVGVKNARVIVNNPETIPDPNLKQVYNVKGDVSVEDLLRYSALPGVRLVFDKNDLPNLSDATVSMLPTEAKIAYDEAVNANREAERLERRAMYETGVAVDPMTKLLDGPHGMSNPLVRDSNMVQKLLPEYYVTWRVEGGQGDLEMARRAGFKMMRRPKDDTEAEEVSPLDWSGEIWRVRDGTVDPTSGDEIYNVMVVIRERAWKDNLDAMSMISHNAYATNKKQFVEGVDNLSRDMLSSRERIEVTDLDELHVEEHSVIQNGKRVIDNSQAR